MLVKVKKIFFDVFWPCCLGLLHFMNEFISLKMVAMEAERKFLSFIATVAARKKNFFKNLNITDSYHHCKNWVDWITVGWGKMSQPQKCKFLENGNER